MRSQHRFGLLVRGELGVEALAQGLVPTADGLKERRPCDDGLLDAIETSGHAGDSVVVLWSDHGRHLGEKVNGVWTWEGKPINPAEKEP